MPLIIMGINAKFYPEQNLIRFFFIFLTISKFFSMQKKMVENILLANILIANEKGVHIYLIYFSAALVFSESHRMS